MSVAKGTVLVTGGAGYIGSHCVLSLKDAGYKFIILDNLVYGHRDLVENELKVELIEDAVLLGRVVGEACLRAVVKG